MPLKLMYITNRPEIAEIAECAGVDRIFVDMEYIGKEKRQVGIDTVKCHHTVDDVKAVRGALTKAELLVRLNPLYEGSGDEVEGCVEAGADYIMLPYFHTAAEVRQFADLVAGRVSIIPLVETPGAVDEIDDILEIPGINEVYIGLNDLSLGYHKKFMFELLSDGTVERLAFKIRQGGMPFGFGGIASIGHGTLPSEMIIREHYRLGSTRVILSRSFCDVAKTDDIDEIRTIFTAGIRGIRRIERECETYRDYFSANEQALNEKIKTIVDTL